MKRHVLTLDLREGPGVVEAYRAHHDAMAAIRAIEGELDDDIRDRIACETWDHYPEHTEQILAWLKQAGPNAITEPV